MIPTDGRFSVVLVGAASVFLGLCVLRLRAADLRHRRPIGDFGATPNGFSRLEREALFAAYLWQQRFSFGVLLAAILCSLVLAVVLVARLVGSEGLDMTFAATGTGLAADIGLSRWSWKLYTRASSRLEALGRG